MIPFIFQMQMNMKLYHWMTTSLARHKASDELVDKITELGDRFMEVYIGKYGRASIPKRDTSMPLLALDDKSVHKFLEDGVKFLQHELPKSLKKDDVDLLTIRDDMLATLHQTKYLFTLS